MRLSDARALQQGRYAATVERNVPASINRGLLASRNSELEGLAYGVAAASDPLEYMVSEGVIPEALEYEPQTLAGRGLIQGVECGDQLAFLNRRRQIARDAGDGLQPPHSSLMS
jgi:hypothetical protein